VDDGKLVFGASPLTRIIKNKKVKYWLHIFLPKKKSQKEIHCILFVWVHLYNPKNAGSEIVYY
jgi:hypothetical protein